MLGFVPRPAGPPIILPADTKPILLVVVDTEEEFDWTSPFDRGATSVTHMREIGRFQEICDEAGVRPAYMIDFPIATKDESLSVLAPLLATRRAEIGTHLHPWVNPPFEEVVTSYNSYPGNLPPALEQAKLATLTEAITSNLGVQPTTYKAGRYGLGPTSVSILDSLGYRTDLSFCPPFDFAADGGPNYSDASAAQVWLDRPDGILELPATGGFVGSLRAYGPALQRVASHPFSRALRLENIFNRTGLLTRVRLSPEGFSLAHTCALTDALLADGVKILTLTLHSPSVKPSCTPYVQNNEQVSDFLDHIRQFLHYFLNDIGGISMTPNEVRNKISMQYSKYDHV